MEDKMHREEPMKRNIPRSVTLTDLEPGTIILYRDNPVFYPIQAFIKAMQALFCNQEHGHYDTTHAAIFVGHGEQGPLIAHIADNGYILHPMSEYDPGLSRAFLVFRLKSDEGRAEIAKVAASDEHKKLLWKGIAACSPLFVSPELDPERERSQEPKGICTWTFCSQFVIKVLKMAALNRGGEAYPHIRSCSSPKSLEACLFSDPHYEINVYLGIEPYAALKAEIKTQVDKIKHERVTTIFTQITEHLERPEAMHLNLMTRILTLLKVMQPLLERFASFSEVAKLARKRGIFERDLRDSSLDKLKQEVGCSGMELLLR